MPARPVPAPPSGQRPPGPGPVTSPPADQLAKGSEVKIARCPIHGVAYDDEREACPECAKTGGG